MSVMHWTQWLAADALAEIADELETRPGGARAAADTRQILALAEALDEVWGEQDGGTPEGLRAALARYAGDDEGPITAHHLARLLLAGPDLPVEVMESPVRSGPVDRPIADSKSILLPPAEEI